MRERNVMAALLFAVGLATLGSVMPMSAQTQARTPAVPTWTLPRTADGKPDLQGTYDAATITPIERPGQFGNRQALTAAEASALERSEAERDQKLNESTSADSTRTAPPVGGATPNPDATYLERVFEAGGGIVGGYNNFWMAAGSQVTTIRGEKRTSIVIDPPNGRVPPMNATARERNAAYLRTAVSPDAAEGGGSGPVSAFDNPEARPLAERCLLGFSSTSGPPTLPNYFYNNLKQIVQTKDHVLIFVEMVHDARVIRIGGTHPPASVRSWMGDSIGHWEGDTLVVETTNFTDKTQFRGSGDKLKVTEHFTRTGSADLVYRFTVEDPSTWDRPWTGEYNWKMTTEQIFEYACHEGNHGLENVLRGARATERENRR